MEGSYFEEPAMANEEKKERITIKQLKRVLDSWPEEGKVRITRGGAPVLSVWPTQGPDLYLREDM